MEFWGLEVQAGESIKVIPNEDCRIFMSKASLDRVAVMAEGEHSAYLYVTIEEKKIVIGTLPDGNVRHISLDLHFHKEFELSHSLQSGSVHFTGHQSPKQLEPCNRKRKPAAAAAAAASTPQRTGKSVFVPCSESKANVKKQKKSEVKFCGT
ncbi:histone deacetylase HDT2-like [Eutrema salsugineum]|uniref:histone deacetylase HDT2-like n=1 Tax=Eutrema salsugineum TaxID=72664 RepID=UPI000CED790B|nr:histone deacetylase HDT2-like [Eutrema salsugineum]